MPEVPKPTDQIPTGYSFDAIVITGALDPQSKIPKLDAGSSMQIFTGAIAEQAGITGGLILAAEDSQITDLMEERLNESLVVDDERPVSVLASDGKSSDAQLIKAVRARFPNLNRLGFITSNDRKKQDQLKRQGIRLDEVLPEDILNEQIAASAANSPRTLMKLAMEIGDQFLKYKRVLMGGVSLYRVAEKPGSSA